MGKGITYDKKAGDCVDVEQVEKQFVPSNKRFFNEISGNIIGYSIKIFRSQ